MTQQPSLSHATPNNNALAARRLGIDTRREAVIFMREDCHVCRSEGLATHARVHVANGVKSIIATLYQVTSDLLAPGEAGLSEVAWQHLSVVDGDPVTISHAPPLQSLRAVRARIYGNRLSADDLQGVIDDVVAERYSDIDLSAFLTGCAAMPLDPAEIVALTGAMVNAGERLHWSTSPVVDKHSVGGLPGNRTTPLVVAIVAACGLTMPKTSSRAITSPAGTADTMEVLAPVELDTVTMRRVVEREGGCIVWGGAMRLSPADDILIRVERALDIDSEGQLVASVLSKKIAAGSTHLVLDMPVGPTAKVRSKAAASVLSVLLSGVGDAFGLKTRLLTTGGNEPVGRGIGPALEARDVLAVLQGEADAPQDLRDRALELAAALLELGGAASEGEGAPLAAETLANGEAWAKFQAICEAQGGMRTPPQSTHRMPVVAPAAGRIAEIDNRRIAKVAKLAGAPDAKAAGIELHAHVGDRVEANQPLYTVHAQSTGELAYALSFARANPTIFRLSEE